MYVYPREPWTRYICYSLHVIHRIACITIDMTRSLTQTSAHHH